MRNIKKFYFPDSEDLRYTVELIDGTLTKDGKEISYDKKGNPIKITNYKEGVIHGKSMIYCIDNNANIFAYFIMGKMVSKLEWLKYIREIKLKRILYSINKGN